MLRTPWTAARGWYPWDELARMRSEMERLLEGGASPFDASEHPRIDIWSGEKGLKLVAELPGYSADDIELSVVGDVLTLKGGHEEGQPESGTTVHRRERATGRFTRSLQLPYEIESDEVRARLENGLLEVDLPRAKAQRPRKIAVASS